jgi:hypothetical protein
MTEPQSQAAGDLGENPRPDVAPSRNRATGWVLLILFLVPGAWFLWKIETTIGLRAPRLWELLRDEPTFGFAMLDFFLTAGWAILVLIERADLKAKRNWWILALFCAVPTLGIAAFLLAGRERPRVEASRQ